MSVLRLVSASAISLTAIFSVSACAGDERPAAGPQLTGEERGEVVDADTERFLQEMVETEHLSGAVLVSRNGRILHERSYGPSSETLQNRVGDRFHIASMTKQFTAAAVMRLVEMGAVALDGSINNYLPAAYRSDVWADVQIQHLLSHTSGIPDYAETRDYYEVVDGWAFGATVDGMIREAMAEPLNFTPGTQFRYSNIGYTLLGQIIDCLLYTSPSPRDA